MSIVPWLAFPGKVNGIITTLNIGRRWLTGNLACLGTLPETMNAAGVAELQRIREETAWVVNESYGVGILLMMLYASIILALQFGADFGWQEPRGWIEQFTKVRTEAPGYLFVWDRSQYMTSISPVCWGGPVVNRS